MLYFPNRDKLLHNFSCLNNWEEKYLYMIDLGKHLPQYPKNMKTIDYLISNCQNQVWIFIKKNIKISNTVKMYGDSDSAIIKGLLAIIFIIYRDMTIEEILHYDIQSILKNFEFTQYLTSSRSQGLSFILENIHKKISSKMLL